MRLGDGTLLRRRRRRISSVRHGRGRVGETRTTGTRGPSASSCSWPTRSTASGASLRLNPRLSGGGLRGFGMTPAWIVVVDWGGGGCHGDRGGRGSWKVGLWQERTQNTTPCDFGVRKFSRLGSHSEEHGRDHAGERPCTKPWRFIGSQRRRMRRDAVATFWRAVFAQGSCPTPASIGYGIRAGVLLRGGPCCLSPGRAMGGSHPCAGLATPAGTNRTLEQLRCDGVACAHHASPRARLFVRTVGAFCAVFDFGFALHKHTGLNLSSTVLRLCYGRLLLLQGVGKIHSGRGKGLSMLSVTPPPFKKRLP